MRRLGDFGNAVARDGATATSLRDAPGRGRKATVTINVHARVRTLPAARRWTVRALASAMGHQPCVGAARAQDRQAHPHARYPWRRLEPTVQCPDVLRPWIPRSRRTTREPSNRTENRREPTVGKSYETLRQFHLASRNTPCLLADSSWHDARIYGGRRDLAAPRARSTRTSGARRT